MPTWMDGGRLKVLRTFCSIRRFTAAFSSAGLADCAEQPSVHNRVETANSRNLNKRRTSKMAERLFDYLMQKMRYKTRSWRLRLPKVPMLARLKAKRY